MRRCTFNFVIAHHFASYVVTFKPNAPANLGQFNNRITVVVVLSRLVAEGHRHAPSQRRNVDPLKPLP